jgi:hypothetical protein
MVKESLLFGAAEVLLQALEAVLDPGGRLAYDSDLAAARLQLSETTFAKAWEKGRMRTLE